MSVECLNKSEDTFYTNGEHYWSEIPATLDGMLGGFGFVSQTDIKDSKMLLKQLFNSKVHPGRQHALDCGAGIGRVSKFLLTEMFDKVDMVEQNAVFLEQAKKYLGPKLKKIGNFYTQGLQNFQPEPDKYDVIWVQWVLGHLTNNDLIQFLISCQRGLKKDGVIIIKENITSAGEPEKDEQDSSVTRPLHQFHSIFQQAKLKCSRQIKQQHFPKGLFPVYMFILKPSNDNGMESNTSENGINNESVSCEIKLEPNNCLFEKNTNLDISNSENSLKS